jgi:hypothetical protein
LGLPLEKDEEMKDDQGHVNKRKKPMQKEDKKQPQMQPTPIKGGQL